VIYPFHVAASISFLVSESKLFMPLQDWAKKKLAYLGEFLWCGYCLDHWVAFGLVAIYQPKLFNSWWLLDHFLTALVIPWVGVFQWICLCWLMEKAEK
jgi:hypothetical protein